MRTLLRLEELAQFLLCVVALIMNDVPWWAYLLLALGPDIGMLGYLASPRTGAITYNVLHHKGVAILLAAGAIGSEAVNLLSGAPSYAPTILLASVILYGHASMDRVFGYGLKFGDNFHHTHLGWIGGTRREPKESTGS